MGAPKRKKAAQTASETFGGSGVSANLPEIFVTASELAEGTPLYALLVKAGFAASNGEARRLIKGNGVKLNDAPVTDENRRLAKEDLSRRISPSSRRARSGTCWCG